MTVDHDTWAGQFKGPTPATANTLLDLVSTTEFEHPQPFTISFDRFSLNHAQNSAMRAEITYRTQSISRTVLCDWRGQASLTAQQVQVRAKSFAPAPGAYEASLYDQTYSAMVGLGALAKSSVLCTGVTELMGLASPEPLEILINRMATRLILRASRLTGSAYSGIVEDLIGAAEISLARLAGQYIFHSEPLQPSHFAQGIDLGDADSVWITLPAGLAGDSALITPVFELAL